jgi:hypothetical protein
MKRLLLVLILVATGLGLTTAAHARPLPEVCIQYVDPIHMGSYPVCPLDR